jgi:uncharacterized protein YbjT (DUF2867 family)
MSEDAPTAGPTRRLLVAGATGYVGGRLSRVLHGRGWPVRCMARRPEHLRSRLPAEIEVVAGDVLDSDTLAPALEGIDTAFYLVHSMGSETDFEAEDRRAAANFARAAREAGVRRIVYLGGLGAEGDLSPHLASRQEVGRILRESGVETVELRASIILGSGSLSFELIRALVERLPVMLTPRWLDRLAQPIAIDDVLAYLVAAVEVPLIGSVVVEIGGPEPLSYGDLMEEYARQRGLRRVLIRVPVLTPRLSSLWLALVTPVYARVGRKLIDSVRNDTVVASSLARELFPGIQPRSAADAMAVALADEERELTATRWADALSMLGEPRSWGGTRFGPRLLDSRTVTVATTAERAFAPIRRIGGEQGWYAGNRLWRARGFLDRLTGGPGLRRGRRSPDQLAVGDTVDFWRVEAFVPGRLLRLQAEMKVPGRAWLQFEVEEAEGEGGGGSGGGGGNRSTIRQTAVFDPVGLPGLLYWYSLFPVHGYVFGGMLRGIARAALAGTRDPAADPPADPASASHRS